MTQSTSPGSPRTRARSSGEGSIRLRSDGRWEGRFYVMEDGRAVRRSIFNATEKEVVKRLRAELIARDNGKPSPHGTETVGSFL